jgi:hypothetical protein
MSSGCASQLDVVDELVAVDPGLASSEAQGLLEESRRKCGSWPVSDSDHVVVVDADLDAASGQVGGILGRLVSQGTPMGRYRHDGVGLQPASLGRYT